MILLPAILAIYATQAEQDQVAALFQAHHLAMYNLARQILNSHEDAEDAVQEAFIVIHGQLEKLEDVYSDYARGFLLLTAKFISLNKIRKRRREKSISLDALLYELPSQGGDVFSRIETEALLAEIRELPDTPRDILLLKVLHQCSDKELAKMMGIGHDATRKRVERARALLAERFHAYEA